MELITGRTGTQHVKAIDDAEMYKATFGDGDYVLETGAKFQAEMSGTSAVIIKYGTALMQGRQCKIRKSDLQETLEIDSGTAGYKRWDVVCIEYNEADGIESAQLVVVKGSTSSSWQEPTIPYENGDIDSGETHQMKLWGVKLDGINFDSFVDYRVMIDKKPIDVGDLIILEDEAEIQPESADIYRINLTEEYGLTDAIIVSGCVTADQGTLGTYSSITNNYPVDEEEKYGSGVTTRYDKLTRLEIEKTYNNGQIDEVDLVVKVENWSTTDAITIGYRVVLMGISNG